MHSPTLRSMSEYNKIEMQPPRHIDRNLEPDPIKIQIQIENVIPDLEEDANTDLDEIQIQI